MKIIAKRKPLAEAFNTAASFCSRQNIKPILQMVKLTANGRVMLEATDLEIGCRIPCSDVEVQKPGSAMLPVDRIGGLLKESTDDEIVIEATKEKVVAKTNRGEFRMNAVDVAEFPSIAAFDRKLSCWSVLGEDFAAGMRLVTFATETESSRYALGGVCLSHDQNAAALHLVATDGRRLARFRIACEDGGHTPETTTVIRESSIIRIARSLGSGEVKIHSRANDVLFFAGDSEFYARKIEGIFPDWRRMPGAVGDSFSTHCGPLFSTIRQAGLMLGKGREASRTLDFRFNDGTLTVQAEAADRGAGEVEMPVAFDGKVTVTLDMDYLGEWLTAVGNETLVEFKPGNGRGCMEASAFDGAANYLLMPCAKER